MFAAPPFPPAVALASSSVSSLSLRLRPVNGTPTHGYTIHYKQEFGDWETVQVPTILTYIFFSYGFAIIFIWLHIFVYGFTIISIFVMYYEIIFHILGIEPSYNLYIGKSVLRI